MYLFHFRFQTHDPSFLKPVIVLGFWFPALLELLHRENPENRKKYLPHPLKKIMVGWFQFVGIKIKQINNWSWPLVKRCPWCFHVSLNLLSFFFLLYDYLAKNLLAPKWFFFFSARETTGSRPHTEFRRNAETHKYDVDCISYKYVVSKYALCLLQVILNTASKCNKKMF